MKNLLIVLTIFVSMGCNAQVLLLGNNIQTEFSKIEKPFYSPAPRFTGWAEGDSMILISAKAELAENDFVFVALSDTTLIGAFKTTTPYYFLLDTNGDSILDSRPGFFLLPAWTIKAKMVPDDKRIVEIFDEINQITLEADSQVVDEKIMHELGSYLTDTSLANRQIALLFDNYNVVINETTNKGIEPPSDICVPLMKSLSNECLSTFNFIPVIVYIYMGESYQDAGMYHEAENEFKRGLEHYPNSIMLLVYQYTYETDEVKKASLLADLKKKYPNHWLVKRF